MNESEEEDRGYCPACAGSGEGQYDGTRCPDCKGRGELNLNEEEEQEYYHDDY